jgi:hypothetical protein
LSIIVLSVPSITSADQMSKAVFKLSILLLALVTCIGLVVWNRKEKNDFGLFTTINNKVEKMATSGRLYKVAKLRTFDERHLLFQNDPKRAFQNTKRLQWPQDFFWNRPDCKNWGAATTIFPPTEAVEKFSSLDGWCLVVAGDEKGPESYDIQNAKGTVVFLSRERQKELEKYLEFAKETPWNHFARKNIAYLYAIANGAHFIWDFDDDNILYPNETLSRYTVNAANAFNSNRPHQTTTILVPELQNSTECGVFNPYPFYRPSVIDIWPRGYPLDKINSAECQLRDRYCLREVPSHRIGIFQSVADKDPDVDAIYRLTRALPIHFKGAVEDHPVVVPPHTMSPMNAQASLFSRVAMWSLFLPTTVHGRVSDIWRSYIAQALAKQCDILTAFVGPHVTQERNSHTYLADLDAEQQLYERSGSLVNYLINEWEYDHPNPSFEGAWERIFVDLYERGVVDQKDVRLAQLWISSLQSIGYEFPTFQRLDRLLTTNDSNCKPWKNVKSAGNESKTPSFEDVVLVGHFNYKTSASIVSNWVKHWRQVFKYVDVRGPFDNDTITVLRESGINVFLAENDEGWHSPVKTLADTLRLYVNDLGIRGVIMSHDDLLFNVSRLVELGIPSDNAIVLEESANAVADLSKPYVTVYGNETFRLGDNMTLLTNVTEALYNWPWWKNDIPKIAKAALSIDKTLLDSDGGIALYNDIQSDFIYVPTKLANEFTTQADWLVQNEIFLEMATPVIAARLYHQVNASVTIASLCTKWGDYDRSKLLQWLAECFGDWERRQYAIYHPVKVGRIGMEMWNMLFDMIVLGQAQHAASVLAVIKDAFV